MNWCIRLAREFCPLWVIVAVLISGSVSAQDDFCSQDGVPARIFANIPVTMVGNLQDFLKTNDLERLVTHRATVCYDTGSCQGLLTFA
jgi:hypothetical protein